MLASLLLQLAAASSALSCVPTPPTSTPTTTTGRHSFPPLPSLAFARPTLTLRPRDPVQELLEGEETPAPQHNSTQSDTNSTAPEVSALTGEASNETLSSSSSSSSSFSSSSTSLPSSPSPDPSEWPRIARIDTRRLLEEALTDELLSALNDSSLPEVEVSSVLSPPPSTPPLHWLVRLASAITSLQREWDNRDSSGVPLSSSTTTLDPSLSTSTTSPSPTSTTTTTTPTTLSTSTTSLPSSTSTTTVNPSMTTTTTTTTTTSPPTGCCPALMQTFTSTEFPDGLMGFSYNNEACRTTTVVTCSQADPAFDLFAAIVANGEDFLDYQSNSVTFPGTCMNGVWFMGTPPLQINTLECRLTNPPTG